MYDVIIIGAGASGLFSAVLLSGAGKKVLVLEQNPAGGEKLSLCGGGNCNLGPVECESEALSARYTQFSLNVKTGHMRQEPVRPLKTLYYAYQPLLVRKLWTSGDLVHGLFRGLGIEFREEEGLLYPARFDARSLARELCRRAEKAGVRFVYGSKVTAVKKAAGGYEVNLAGASEGAAGFLSRVVILAAGGFSYPSIGGNDSGNILLKSLGIGCRPGMPAMGPVAVRNYPFAASSGTAVTASVNLVPRAGGAKLARAETGQVLCTHRGFSGPAILDMCAAVHECAKEDPVLVFDFMPHMSREALLAAMQKQAHEHPRRHSEQLLSLFFTRAFSGTFLTMAGIAAEKLCAEVSKAEMIKAVELVKAMRLDPVTPVSRDEAMSWTGGCEAGEIDFATMEARKAPGLFVTGDMVAMCRPCGGYSLWFCWTSALAAAVKICAAQERAPLK
jgi:predicted Rossmann fold flavoprotein